MSSGKLLSETMVMVTSLMMLAQRQR